MLYIWGILFMVITTMIAIFKTEKDSTQEDGYVKLNISKTYSLLWDIIKLPSIRILATALLTARVNIVKAYLTPLICFYYKLYIEYIFNILNL